MRNKQPDPHATLTNATSSVVRVLGGRGFIVEGRRTRYIITASHCLPELPPAFALEQCTYPDCVGSVGEEPTISATCLFADPAADIALLGPPDNQDYSDEYERYMDLVDGVHPLAVSDAPGHGTGYLLSLECKWFKCEMKRPPDGPLWLSETDQQILGGMSGSPILDQDARAVGVVAVAVFESNHDIGNHPVLHRNLPGWLLRDLGLIKQPRKRATA